MKYVLFKEARIINRGEILEADLLVHGDRIERIAPSIQLEAAHEEVRVNGKYLMPGIIDDQVHFREPGLEHKANIYSESRAAIAGGVTSFMEMPNTKPPAITQELLEDKYQRAAKSSWANYSFFMGTTNDNLEEIKRTDPTKVCGVKIFMGSSTGNMLVDDQLALDRLFAECPTLIATHCEDEETIRKNMEVALAKYGQAIPPSAHPVIRSREACLLSSSLAVVLAKKHNTRLHILHISTAEETLLFDPGPLEKKRITAEACVHHMFYTDQDYIQLGNQIKCNPAIKLDKDRKAVLKAVMEDRIDVIATDHAPHTWEEKAQPYAQSPSGLPLIQHGLLMMLTHYKAGTIALEKIIDKMCHKPADLFRIVDRGYLDEGKFADLVVLDLNKETTVTKENLFYKCGWSPLEGKSLPGSIDSTWLNGACVYSNGEILGEPAGRRLVFGSR